MNTTLYSVASSHPGYAAHLMLAHKRIDHSVVNLVPGLHPPVLRAVGFAAGTVPALILGARRVQGSRQISRALDEVQPEPTLFGAGVEERRRVEEAERWGEENLQPVPRRLFRWLMCCRRDARTLIFRNAGLPAPGLLGLASPAIARYYASRIDATDEGRIARMIAALPRLLDRVDRLLDEGTLGTEQRNAADFQVATTVRMLLTFEDLRPLIERHQAATYATAIIPTYPFAVPRGFVPREWLGRAGGPEVPPAS